jgi:hypothetical protein
MPTVAIDTLKVAHKLQAAGMPRKQAEAVAEAVADVYPTKDAVIESVETLGRAMDRRFTSMQEEHRSDIARIEAMLVKLLEGQAVLHQNDMELKRRLDERK